MDKSAGQIKDILWDTVYSGLMRKDWYEVLYPILSSSSMRNVYAFLHGLDSKISEGQVTPIFKNIFAPFDIFNPEQTKLVILGDSPNLYVPGNNNGLAYSFKHNTEKEWNRKEERMLYTAIESCEFQNLCDDLYKIKYKNLQKLKYDAKQLKRFLDESPVQDSVDTQEYFQLLSEIESELEHLDVEWYPTNPSTEFPMDNLALQGVLMMYVTPTITVNTPTNTIKHRNAWKGFTEGVLNILSEQFKNLIFLTFEDRPTELVKNLVDSKKHLLMPIKDSDALVDNYITIKINNFINATRGGRKVIDFKLIEKNYNGVLKL